MSDPGPDAVPPREGAWRSYRCPVCGHADEVAVEEGRTLRIRCDHCDASLEVEGGKAGTGKVSVHVASDDPADG